MDTRIPKYWSRQFKSLTGLEATYEDYMKNPSMFQPETLYEENPVMAWISIIVLGFILLWGICVVFFS